MGGTDDAMNNNPDVASLVPPTLSPTVTPSYVPTTFTPVPTPTPTTVPIPAPSPYPTLSPSHDTDWKGEKPMVSGGALLWPTVCPSVERRRGEASTVIPRPPS
jgi:hypothetical protein